MLIKEPDDSEAVFEDIFEESVEEGDEVGDVVKSQDNSVEKVDSR